MILRASPRLCLWFLDLQAHMTRPNVPVVMTVAGSDSGGGAGIQADLKAFSAIGVMGTSAITCLTAQNPDEVAGIVAVDPGFVDLQIRTICRGFKVAAAKTGMLYSRDIIRTVAAALRRNRIGAVVVDPVMVSTSGAKLLRDDAVKALCTSLLPIATVVTPNLQEAEILWGHSIRSLADLEKSAVEIGGQFGIACVTKGGHLAIESRARKVVDVLFDGKRVHRYVKLRVPVKETHGTGCTFSAALAAYLAKGQALPEAVGSASAYIGRAIRLHVRTGRHTPLGWGGDV
ncbi:MAG: bifunctional hydroxymethylpyrimidine kinase/phosphomethylpyrimidine kinase [Verrucomicrobia bacterium]|nr:bifunctional hydroxymethylpyrimidine kinase/phosphomethylpyrimidine kinase [Verrucomicrobiota bacterium]